MNKIRIVFFYTKNGETAEGAEGLGERCNHRLNMELDLQSSLGSMCTAVLIWGAETTQLPPLSPRTLAHIRGRYWSAKMDDKVHSNIDFGGDYSNYY
jgi:hypothetical protein